MKTNNVPATVIVKAKKLIDSGQAGKVNVIDLRYRLVRVGSKWELMTHEVFNKRFG